MSDQHFVERLYETGFTDLISVIPPKAQLVPSSKVLATGLGKTPGVRLPNNLWRGYNWRAAEHSLEDVRRWTLEGANTGLRADRFPAVDIDCMNENLAKVIENAALGELGPAPIRFGRWPKRLLMYRTDAPFSRMRMIIKVSETESHLVEILGAGQQYLVHGTHPSGSTYSWQQDPADFELTTITRESAEAFLNYLGELIAAAGFGEVTRIGDGRKTSPTAASNQDDLRAPSIELLAEAVALIPNDDVTAPTRDEYVRMGYAIRAAAGEENSEDGYNIFAGWAGAHEQDGRVGGNPETWRSDWRRLTPPYSVGWAFIAEIARGYGFNDAALDFEVVEATARDGDPQPPQHSDQWLAKLVVENYKGVLRYVPQRSSWLVYEGGRWQPDAELLAENLIAKALNAAADRVLRQLATAKNKKALMDLAKSITSAGKVTAVAQLVRADRAIAVGIESLDHNPWELNTPAGIVDLKTGLLAPSNPDALCTKSTSVPPEFGGACPAWKRFLWEATGGDQALEGYLQRLCGYTLTGSTREQSLAFIYGPGGNGKSVFLEALAGIIGDYAQHATMTAFTASKGDKHSTDIAALKGARLVTASETTAGKYWDEALVKSITGGEAISARFMRQDNFVFKPQFKLVFSGNYRPETRDVGPSMRRRLHMIPFITEPAVVDLELSDKLKEEWPAILAWMIEGCLAWQRDGLQPPAVVLEASEDYFDTEDALGRWMTDCTVLEPGATATTQSLFQSWREWAGMNNEWPGKLKSFATALAARKFERWTDPKTRHRGFVGIRVDESRQGLAIMT